MTRPTLSVDISFVDNPFLFFGQVWTDVTADVLSIPEIRRGRERIGAAVRAGTARVVLDNASGNYTPGNWASPYATYLLPLRRIRIRATWSGITYTLFMGFIERWPPAYPGGLDSTVELECADWFIVLASEPITLSRGSEDSHWRLLWLATFVQLDGARNIPTSGNSAGKSAIAAVSLVDTPPLSHMQAVVDAEDGLLFVTGAGIVTFQGRHHRLLDTTATAVQLILGDESDITHGWVLGTSLLGITTIPRAAGWVAGNLNEHPHLRVAMAYDVQDIVNQSTVTASGGTPQTAEDAASVTRYGTRAIAKTLLLTSDGDAAARAAWDVARGKEAALRFNAVTVSGLRDDTLWPLLFGLDLSYRVEVRVRPPGSRAIIRESYVEQIIHRDLHDRWESVLSLSPAVINEAIGVYGDAIYDVSVYAY